MKHILTLFLFLLLHQFSPLFAQNIGTQTRQQIAQIFNTYAQRETALQRPIRIRSIRLRRHRLTIHLSSNASYLPYRTTSVSSLYRQVRQALPASYRKYPIDLITDGQKIEQFIPLTQRTSPISQKRFSTHASHPLVERLSSPNHPTQGLSHRHIALWPSHGYYFEPQLNRWEWQRARMLQTVEDLYPQSYVLSYLVPMLENAGANVLLPRERDLNPCEVIVDNDPGIDISGYTEQTGKHPWQQGDKPGFAHLRSTYHDLQNPFREGSYRQCATVHQRQQSLARWTPNIPAAGQYAVYVSYHSLPQSAPDAHYTVYHRGGATHFRVNQRMGGGTWIYLGTFTFNKGRHLEQSITLTNQSAQAGSIVTADAIKIGGGMGHIARMRQPDTLKTGEILTHPNDQAHTSQYPRFCEGARYWLQWAGAPDSIYRSTQGKNDYIDDLRSRALWTNYLAGGSEVMPQQDGLRIPLDLAFAFHTDAGTTPNDSIIGTLGIYSHLPQYPATFPNGVSRQMSRLLVDLVQSSIVRDIRALHEPQWTRRAMWNKNYNEARVPQVPTMLLELLSHQNFADMRYGLDPRFQFTVSRAVYKGILQFIAFQNHQNYVVQPLPVDHFALHQQGKDSLRLTWQPVADPLEPTARAKQYIVYRRIGKGAFDNGTLVHQPHYTLRLPKDVICSFKVTALNEGGESFPSETLSAGRPSHSATRRPVLVINGFNRISAPDDFVAPAPADSLYAGFLADKDNGVAYLRDISYVGKMKEFRRNQPWRDDDASGFGDSYANYETRIIAGNSFDYPSLHGAAIMQSGYPFLSCSDEAVESGDVPLSDYRIVDLILGKEKQTKIGRGGVHPLTFKTFSPLLQQRITDYCKQSGTALFASGAYIGTDLWDNPLAAPQPQDLHFATQVLQYRWRADRAACSGAVNGVESDLLRIKGQYTYFDSPNEQSYVVESPDAIEPASGNAYTVMRYAENNLSAAIAYEGTYKTFIMGFPFESIRHAEARRQLMQQILHFFNPQ